MILHKCALHVLDKQSEVPILNDYECKISQVVDKFVGKLIKKVSKDDQLRKGIYNKFENNIVYNCCEQMIYDQDTFLENSKELAAYLFDNMKIESSMESCDLLIALYTVKDEKYVAMMLLDYKKSFTHEILFEDEKFRVSLKENNFAISEGQRVNQCAIAHITGKNDESQLRVLDKIGAKEDIETPFIKNFLDAKLIEDDKYKTQVFKNSAETWITNALSSDIKTAEDVRSVLNYTLKEKEEIDVDKFVRDALDNEDLRESFKDHMDDKGLNESFIIDKPWVEKKLKKRRIKTDTGFEIKGDLIEFEDPMKYSIKQNPDGSIDLVLKRIKIVEG